MAVGLAEDCRRVDATERAKPHSERSRSGLSPAVTEQSALRSARPYRGADQDCDGGLDEFGDSNVEVAHLCVERLPAPCQTAKCALASVEGRMQEQW